MGMSKTAKTANARNERDYRQTEQQYNDFYNSRETLADEARGRSNTAYDTAFGGYNDVINDSRNGGGSRYYDEFAKTGGLTDENIRRMRGNGVFDEFSQTGGLSQDDIANMRLYGSKTIPGFFDSVKRNLEHSTNVSGYNPGYSGQTRQLARDQSRAAQDAALTTELGIVDTRNKGRQWGTEGLSNAEGQVVDATQRGRMFGIEGMERSNNQSMQNRLAALGGIRGLRTDVPGEVGMYESELMDSMNSGAAARRGLNQDYMQYNPNKSFAERAAPYAKAIASGAAIAATGGAAAPAVAAMYAGGGGGGGPRYNFGGGAQPGQPGGSGSFMDFFNRQRQTGAYGSGNYTPGTRSAGPGSYGIY